MKIAKHALLALALLGQAQAADPTVNISSKRTTTEKALQELSRVTGLRIEIDELELRSHGITKNQTFSLEIKDKTPRLALLRILLEADDRRRLAYFVREDGTIVVTTVYALERRRRNMYKTPEMS